MSCDICQRRCDIDRTAANGFCGCSSVPKVARAALHFDEEPCISGTRGSGTIFFSGCNLKCVFCQNMAIQDGSLGEAVSVERLVQIMLKLQNLGAHNINLVTPTPHREALLPAIRNAKASGLTIPILYNTSAYETIETIRCFDGLCEIYLPDLKYHDNRLAQRFSRVPDYFETAVSAIGEMIRQTGFMRTDENGIAQRGVRIRHLVLPGCVFDTRSVLDEIAVRFGTDCPISLMSQYTPVPSCKEAPLTRRLTSREYHSAVDYAVSLGFSDMYCQGLDSVGSDFTPPFSNRLDL